MLVPKGKIAIGKLAQALVHGAKLLQVDGSFDDCLELARKLAVDYPVALVNSVNPDRIQGQKTAAFEIVDALGDAPDIHCLPVGNAGNITAYWMGYQEYADLGLATKRPADVRLPGQRRGADRGRRAGDAPADDRDRDQDRQPGVLELAEAARDESGGLIDKVTDREILAAYRILARDEAVWGELGSSASVAGLLAAAADGRIPAGLAGGLHDHRQRAQGPGLGAVGRARPDHRPGGRRFRRRRPRAGLTGRARRRRGRRRRD